MDLNMIDQSRFQIALLGSGFVGKSSFLKQYLHGGFSDDYTETVENLYFQQYMINGTMKYVNYLDTAGSMAFPSMRQLYVSKSTGFILFFSIDDAESFKSIKRIWEEIKISRHSLRSIPCIIVGNKLANEDKREVETFDVLEWACSENLGGCILEISSKDNASVKNAFDMLLEQFGNTRTEHRGPFRIHSTSFDRQNNNSNRHKVT
ncbi:ras-related protein Rap-2b-like [Mytilus trossulus]|uniref:ras-related protein Rap-2b-like n=1 Tax=Mytilus trossulus TaxID=6551 RepID=UPI00300611A2